MTHTTHYPVRSGVLNFIKLLKIGLVSIFLSLEERHNRSNHTTSSSVLRQCSTNNNNNKKTMARENPIRIPFAEGEVDDHPRPFAEEEVDDHPRLANQDGRKNNRITETRLTEEEIRQCLAQNLGWGPFTTEQWEAMTSIQRQFLRERQVGLHTDRPELVQNLNSFRRVTRTRRRVRFARTRNERHFVVGDKVTYKRTIRHSHPFKPPIAEYWTTGWVVGHTPQYVYVVRNLGRWNDTRYDMIANHNVEHF